MRILLTRLSALGDIVHTWPLAAALAHSAPGVELAWVVEEPFMPLVAPHPAVSVAIPVATRRWRQRPLSRATRREVAAFRRAVREFAAEVAVDPQGLVKSAVLGRLAGSPVRVGFARSHRRELPAGVFYSRTVQPPPEARHVIDIYLSMLSAVGTEPVFGAAPDGTFLAPRTPAAGATAARAAIAFVPGTGGPGKAWGAARFAELARRLGERGVPVVVAWGPGERELADSIVSEGGDHTELAPPTSLPELAALLSRSAVVVGGDTGPVHLAASLGVPTVAVFTATDPARNGPRGRRVAIVSGALGVSRRGRARAERPGDVGVDAVFDAVADELGAARPGVP